MKNSASAINKFLRFILYANTSKEDYQKIYPDMMKSNLSMLKVLSGISVVFFLLCFCLGQFVPNMHTKLLAYTIGLVSSLVILTVVMIAKSHLVTSICMYAFDVLLLSAGLVLTLINAQEQLTITLIPLVLIIPLFFDDKPFKILILMIITDLFYLAMAIRVKPAEILVLDITDVFVFSIVGLLIGTYMAKTKSERYIYAYEIKQKSITDWLTGCFNRHAFDDDSETALSCDDKTNKVIISIDVNGLKVINDTLGHEAGDELLLAVSSALLKVYQTDGKCYRMGGDEFVVVLNEEKGKAESMIAETNKLLAEYKGHYISNVTISTGYVNSTDYPNYTIDKLLRLADKKMYAAKREYYKEKGIDRQKAYV